jgi:Tfp pilus assembly protein PilV
VKGRRPAETGFTTLEVLVAMVLLSVALTATTQLIVFSTAQGHLAKQTSDASTLAAHTIEQYRDANYATIQQGQFITTPGFGTDMYTVTTNVTRDDPEKNMTRVRVNVTWNGGGQGYVSETILSSLQ